MSERNGWKRSKQVSRTEKIQATVCVVIFMSIISVRLHQFIVNPHLTEAQAVWHYGIIWIIICTSPIVFLFPGRDGARVKSIKKLKLLEEHDKERKEAFVNRPKLSLNGIACPDCKLELFDVYGEIFATYPAEIKTYCPHCDYKGTRLA